MDTCQLRQEKMEPARGHLDELEIWVWWVTFIVMLLFGFWTVPAVAGDDWWTLSARSIHLHREAQNNANLGLAREWRIDEKWRGIAGFYDNSSNNLSMYAGGVRSLTTVREAKVGLLVGGVTGYARSQWEPIPLVGLVLSVERPTYGINVIVIPASGGVVHFQVKVPIK